MSELSPGGSTGSIVALPSAITAGAAEVGRVAGDAEAVRGHLASVAVAGCGPEAAGAYAHMSSAWLAELGRMGGETHDMGGKLIAAAGSYQATDATAVPGSGR